MGTIASQITSVTIVYSTVYSDVDQRKYQSSASLAFVRGIHRRPVNSPHKWPVTRKMFPFDDVIVPTIFEAIFQLERIPFMYLCGTGSKLWHSVKYIPLNMHTFVFCFVLFWSCCHLPRYHMIYLCPFFLDCFTGTETIGWVVQCQWNKTEVYWQLRLAPNHNKRWQSANPVHNICWQISYKPFGSDKRYQCWWLTWPIK